MDVVYVVRPGNRNIELRYSLRSLETNLTYDDLWIFGGKPDWIKNVNYVPMLQDGTKFQNAANNIASACHHTEVSDDFVLMNDDFYIINPIDTIPTFHRGSVDDLIEHYQKMHPEGSKYMDGMLTTRSWLHERGISDPKSYSLHTPMVINKNKWLTMWNMIGSKQPQIPYHLRTLYGNLWDIGGKKIEDVKIYESDQKWDETGAFLSTYHISFGYEVGDWLRIRFPTRSQYEK